MSTWFAMKQEAAEKKHPRSVVGFQKQKTTLTGGSQFGGESDEFEKTSTVPYGKGFLQPLLAFCFRYRQSGRVTAVTRRRRDDLHVWIVRSFQMAALSKFPSLL